MSKTGVRIVIHLTIIVILVVVGAVAAHFGLVLFTRHNARVTVPQFKGLILHEAKYTAEHEELRIIINDSLYAPMYEGGMVLDQLPHAGVEVKPGRAVYVTINAYGQKRVQVPYVAGRSLRQAKNMLDVASLQIEELVYTPDIATNYVLSQWLGDVEILEDSKAEAVVGSGVTLYVGRSQRDTTTRMPQLIGLCLIDAKSRLWEAGLNVGEVQLPADITPQTRAESMVYAQSAEDGIDVTLGEAITINLTLDREVVQQALDDIERARIEAERQRAYIEDSLAQERIRALSLEIERGNKEGQQSHEEVNFFE